MNQLSLDILGNVCRFSGCYGTINLRGCTKYLNVQTHKKPIFDKMALDKGLNKQIFEQYHKFTNSACIKKLTKTHKKLKNNILVTNDFIFHYGYSVIIVEKLGLCVYEFVLNNYDNVISIDYMDSHKLLIVTSHWNMFIFYDLTTGKIIKEHSCPYNLIIKYYHGDGKYFKYQHNKLNYTTEIYLIIGDTIHKIYLYYSYPLQVTCG